MQLVYLNNRSHDNSRIACGGADKQVLLIDVSTGLSIRKFRGHHAVSL